MLALHAMNKHIVAFKTPTRQVRLYKLLDIYSHSQGFPFNTMISDHSSASRPILIKTENHNENLNISQ